MFTTGHNIINNKMNILSQPHNYKLFNFVRAFTTAAAPAPPVKGESNIFKGQHVRYIPKKRLRFDYASPEGPLALVYQSSEAFYKRA